MIGIIDYGAGNLRSLQNALEYCGSTPSIVTRADQIGSHAAIILPGVGAFGAAMTRLQDLGFVEALRDWALVKRKPLFGICLGMQLFGRDSEESPGSEGLGLIDAAVVRLKSAPEARVPHMGWNELTIRREGKLLQGLRDPVCYFVHSFGFAVGSNGISDICTATAEHNEPVAAAIERNNVFAVQFHPEKSQGDGLRILANFIEIVRKW